MGALKGDETGGGQGSVYPGIWTFTNGQRELTKSLKQRCTVVRCGFQKNHSGLRLENGQEKVSLEVKRPA